MITYRYEAVRYDGVKGWIATRRINGVHAGKQFGRTQKASREAFSEAEELAYMAAAMVRARTAALVEEMQCMAKRIAELEALAAVPVKGKRI